MHFADYDRLCSTESFLDPDPNQFTEPNPDISGPGVIIGFLAPAYIVFVLLSLNYLLVYDPTHSPFPSVKKELEDSDVESTQLSDNASTTTKGAEAWKPNPFDLHILKFVRRWIKLGPRWHNLGEILEECILNMCDIQVITGHALLISGLISLPNLSALDWTVLTSLVWFCTVTHLAGLTVLRSYLSRHPWVRAVRVASMVSLLAILTVGYIPTFFFNWQRPDLTAARVQSPALCYFDLATVRRLWRTSLAHTASDTRFCLLYSDEHECTVWETSAFESTSIALLLIHAGFIFRCVKMFRGPADLLTRRVRQPLSAAARSFLRKLALLPTRGVSGSDDSHVPLHCRVWFDLVVVPALALFLAARIVLDFLGSLFLEVLWGLILLVWGTLRVMRSRSDRSLFPQATASDSEWNFGQLMAILLLLSPVTSMIWKFVMDRAWHTKHASPVHHQVVAVGCCVASAPFPAQPSAARFSSESSDSQQPQPLPGGSWVRRWEAAAAGGFVDRDFYASSWPWVCLAFCAAPLVQLVQFWALLNPGGPSSASYALLPGIGSNVAFDSLLVNLFMAGGLDLFVLRMPFPCLQTLAVGLLLHGWLSSPTAAARPARPVRLLLYAAACATLQLLPILWHVMSPGDEGFLLEPYYRALRGAFTRVWTVENIRTQPLALNLLVDFTLFCITQAACVTVYAATLAWSWCRGRRCWML